MKNLVRDLAKRFGYTVSRLPDADPSGSPYSPLAPENGVIDLEKLAAMGNSVPGMVSAESGKFLYTMCALQQTEGAVVEIGSWQGRSTSFLARAVAETGNGPFYAVDHFKGNVGKENFYVVGSSDLSDLRGNFEANMKRLGLWDSVELLDMPNSEAVEKIEEQIRYLFIDGDHTKAGVEKDIELFVPKLAAGALVVFDDYEANFAGLVEAANALVARVSPRHTMTYRGTLVVQT